MLSLNYITFITAEKDLNELLKKNETHTLRPIHFFMSYGFLSFFVVVETEKHWTDFDHIIYWSFLSVCLTCFTLFIKELQKLILMN
jgi:hypothetical protein